MRWLTIARAPPETPVAVHRLDPIVVADSNFRGIGRAHPVWSDPDATATHEQVVLVFGVIDQLFVRGRVPHHREPDPIAAELRFA